ncbi:hypothetical protein GGR50DRAFT_701801 [Xylaria sp. CBS 124048]|nr:hypothetical protein GGR50DRAFT_701801 [Xylaria sp. CBS 124048]
MASPSPAPIPSQEPSPSTITTTTTSQSKTRSRASRRSRRNRSQVPVVPAPPQAESDFDDSSDEDYQSSAQPQPQPQYHNQQLQPVPRRRKARTALPVVGNEVLPVGQTAGNLVNSTQDTLANVAGAALAPMGNGGGAKNDTLKLRLDLNLDVEVTLKARIHGDLTLALLGSPPSVLFSHSHGTIAQSAGATTTVPVSISFEVFLLTTRRPSSLSLSKCNPFGLS